MENDVVSPPSAGRSYGCDMGERVGSGGRPKVGGGCDGGGRGSEEVDDEACCIMTGPVPFPFCCRLPKS